MKKVIYIFLLIICATSVKAQISFIASAPKAVEVGKAFQLSFTVNAETSGFRAPQINGLRLLSGPRTSKSSQFSFVNGKQTQSVSTGYTYTLMAQKEGTFTIGAAKITVKGKTYNSNTLKIVAVRGRKKTGAQGGSEGENAEISANDLFVRLNLTKTTVFQGEPVTATIKLYTRLDLVGFNDMKFPDYNGFWSQNLKSPTNVSLKRETYNGEIYNVALLKQTLLFPQKTGKITIEPYTLNLVVKEKVGKARNFFGQIVDRYQRAEKKISTPKRVVNVKPLPGNQPANFSGFVGSNVSFNVEIDTKEIKQDEGITLKVKISGAGNLKLLDEIPINLPSSFEKYPPKIKEYINNSANGASGSKTFEYFFVARDPGNFRVPPIEFSYFDTKSKSFKTLSSDEISIKVNKSKGSGNSNSLTNAGSQSEIENKGTDIRFIKTNNLTLYKTGNHFAGTTLFLLSFPFGILILISLLFLRRKKIILSADNAENRNRKASKISKKRLKIASKYLQDKNNDAFYKEILQAILGYLSDKLKIPIADISKEKILEEFEDKNINDDLKNSTISLINTCEFAQYAPVSKNENPENTFDKASKILENLEKEI